MSSKTEELFLICDLNVFVMAYIFNKSIFFEGDSYSFGKIRIHETVLDEISKWENSYSKKAKFGDSMIKDMVGYCSHIVEDGPILSDQEKESIFRRISHMEERLHDNEKSADTSKADKMYLAIAFKLKANLVTQEKTLSILTRKILGNGRIFNFSDMIIDRIKEGKMSKDGFHTGLRTLKKFKENLPKGDEQKILSMF